MSNNKNMNMIVSIWSCQKLELSIQETSKKEYEEETHNIRLIYPEEY